MSEYKLIAEQQLEIAELKNRLNDFEQGALRVRRIIWGVGGPLNDNAKGYSKVQRLDFKNIIDALPEAGL